MYEESFSERELFDLQSKERWRLAAKNKESQHHQKQFIPGSPYPRISPDAHTVMEIA